MLETIVDRNENGDLIFDFTAQDRRLDYMVSKGFQLLLCYNFMPPCLALDPECRSGERYKNRYYLRSRPRDYREWTRVCREQTAHLVERYGLERVRTWYLQCWNEPDAGYWIGGEYQPANPEAEFKLSEYCKLYDHFAEGVLGVSPELRVGGPACSNHTAFVTGFLRHLAETGTRIDWLSVHGYSNLSWTSPAGGTISPDNLVRLFALYRGILHDTGFDRLPLVMDEWGATAGGPTPAAKNPAMIFRETEYFAAFYIRTIDLFLRRRTRPERMMICLSGQEAETVEFDGRRSLLTGSGIPKPIYHAFRFAARLGDRLLPQPPETERGVGVIPTRTANGGFALLCYHFSEDIFAHRDPVLMELELYGATGRFRFRHHRVDGISGNGFAARNTLGAPDPFPLKFRDRIRRAAENTLYEPEQSVSSGGVFAKELVLPANAVSLIELEPEPETPHDGD